VLRIHPAIVEASYDELEGADSCGFVDTYRVGSVNADVQPLPVPRTTPSCTPNNSTTTTAMDEAIEALERGGEGDEIEYIAIIKKFRVDESTLRRIH